ncbi:MAG: LLM class F420-dependent oxidoreductase [Acidimicrobiales bacterium]
MTRLGYQIPNFTYPGGSDGTVFETVAAQAEAADASGFDSVVVMDHLYQLPGLGDPDQIMLECYTVLAALSQRTTSARLGAMVTGNTYRNPGLLAKIVTTLDVVSAGRAMLNIGAGWFEREHIDFGFEFGTFTDRFEKLEEALQIIVPMLRGERPSLDGKHYQANEIINNPAPLGRIPVMIGGNGETKTLRMVAQYADESNLTCGRAEVPQKVDALAAHCERLGRDRSEITQSWLRRAHIAPTMEQARAEMAEFMAARGVDYAGMDDDARTAFEADWVFGNPESVAATLAADLSLGIEGYVLSLVANGHNPERVALLGETATKALA